MRKARMVGLIAGVLLISFSLTGCFPFAMGLLTPIPIQPWVSERMEDKYLHKNDHRTPIMPPIKEGSPPPLCEDPPDQAMVLRAMARVTRGVPYFYEEFRDNIQVVNE